jgi:hypothetical protein
METQLAIKLCDAVDEVADTYARAMADGVISPEEDAAIRRAQERAINIADAQRAGLDCALTLIRAGVTPFAVRKVREAAIPSARLVLPDGDPPVLGQGRGEVPMGF